MDILSTLILGAVVSIVTQGAKKLLPEANPLIFVACLAILGGLFVGIAVPMFPQEVLEKIIYSFGLAVGYYETLKTFVK